MSPVALQQRISAVPTLPAAEVAELLENREPSIRSAACQELGQRGEGIYLEQLLKKLDDSDPAVCCSAVLALGSISGNAGNAGIAAKVASFLKKGLSDSHAQMRGAAVEAIGNLAGDIGDSGYVCIVAALLKDPNARVRRSALGALRTMGEKGLVTRALGDSTAAEVAAKLNEPLLRAAAVQALGTMGEAGAKYINELIWLLPSSDVSIREAVTEALGTLAAKSPKSVSDECVEEIVSLLTDADSRFRAAAAAALGQLANAKVKKALEFSGVLSGLRDDDNDMLVREAAATALLKMGKA